MILLKPYKSAEEILTDIVIKRNEFLSKYQVSNTISEDVMSDENKVAWEILSKDYLYMKNFVEANAQSLN